MAGETLSLGHLTIFSNRPRSTSLSKLEDGMNRRVSQSYCAFPIPDSDSTARAAFFLVDKSLFAQSFPSSKPFGISKVNERSQKLANRNKKGVSSLTVASGRSASNPPVFILNEKPERKLVLEKPERRISNDGPQTRDEETAEDNDSSPLTSDPDHKSGYVALIGKPNAGKSTLMNQIIGQKLSIVTSKPQTTRHRILGICSAPGYQMILYDTPGVVLKRMHKLDDMMMQNVRTAAVNADCVLVVADIAEIPEKVMDTLEEGAQTIIESRPTLLVLNKRDLMKPGEISKKIEWYRQFGGINEVMSVSAKFGHGIEDLKNWLLSKLPLGPAYYPKDHVSNQPEKFFASEIIREKIFIQYAKEIPYVCQVNIITYAERTPPAKDFIEIEIVVERDSQKAIVIGKDGSALKTLATAARREIEEFVGREVYLEIRVKVKENWRKDEDFLKFYGYSGQLI